MAVEHAPADQRGRYGAFSQIGVPAGLILAQLVFFGVGNALSDEQFAGWGWRVPFLLSIVLVGVGLYVRLSVEESPVFRSLRADRVRSTRPIVEVFRERPRALLVLLVAWSIPFFLLVDSRRAVLLIIAVIVLNIGLGASYGPQSALFAELFEARCRCSGASFSYAVGAVLGGGFAPLIATALQSSTGTSLSVSAYMIVVGVISLVAVWAMPETLGRDVTR